MQKTLFEKYGGFSQVNKLVMTFYDNLLDSEEIGPYFDDVEMPRLIDHQTKFMAFLLGGPASFSDDHLRRAHTSFRITNPHFDELKVILGTVLINAGFEEEDKDLVLSGVENQRENIVSAQCR